MTALRIQAVILDAAGTLLCPREPVGESYARMAAIHGVQLPASRLDEAFHRVFATRPAHVPASRDPATSQALERRWWWELVRSTFRAADGSAHFEDFDAFFAMLWDHYADARAWRLLPGVATALASLRNEGRRLAVLSNFDQRLRPLLRDLGLQAGFDVVTLPADAGAAKPDPLIFEVCLESLGLPPQRAVYVGDHASQDVTAARAVGLWAIDVRSLSGMDALPAAVQALEEAA